MIKNIFIACDTANLNRVKKIIKYTNSKKIKISYKFGLAFFYSKNGRSFLSKLNKKQKIFLCSCYMLVSLQGYYVYDVLVEHIS